MARIYINGKTIQVDGALSLVNGKWYDGNGREIDMNNLDEVKEAKTINITIEGNVEKLHVDHCNTITVNGNVRKVDTGSGNVSCRVIEGDADTGSGSIHCDTIMGDADTGSGSIHCNKIGGKADTGSGGVYVNGVKQNKSSRNTGTVVMDNVEFSIHDNKCTNIYSSGEIITGSFTMRKTFDGKKYMEMNKDCTVNGRRIGDMSESELQAWIDAMAKKNKFVTIR